MTDATFREVLTRYLVEENFLWPEEAKAVVDIVTQNEDSMVNRWDERVMNYPPTLLPVLQLKVKDAAIVYLEKTAPKHIALAILKS